MQRDIGTSPWPLVFVIRACVDCRCRRCQCQHCCKLL